MRPTNRRSVKVRVAALLGPLFQIAKTIRSACRSGTLGSALGDLVQLSAAALRGVAEEFRDSVRERDGLESDSLSELQSRVSGLHDLLPDEPGYSYSILIPAVSADVNHLVQAVSSAARQTSPRLEILIGFANDAAQIEQAVQEVRDDFTAVAANIECVHVPIDKSDDPTVSVTNALAKRARHARLLVVGPEDWLRPDLLYRFELALRAVEGSQPKVVLCDEREIDQGDSLVRESHRTRRPPHVPYESCEAEQSCLLVPREVWNAVGGLRPRCANAARFDLCLRLQLYGCESLHVPLPLYVRRVSRREEQRVPPRDVASARVTALRDYAASAQLDWKIGEPDEAGDFRVTPALAEQPPVQVVVLFRDQRELTLRCARSLAAQKGVTVDLLFVNNRSTDDRLSQDLQQLGATVVDADEPFNYSRLNNRGAAESTSPLILFLNNDVCLEPTAVEELARWIQQPGIGAVGGRLLYPDKRIQHAGIERANLTRETEISWRHTEVGTPLWKAHAAHQVRIVEALTAACLLLSREVFESIGQFDEQNFPIAYSDTDLCRRIQAAGLLCLYTPYAQGVHYESSTRGYSSIEDWERSRWLHELTSTARVSDRPIPTEFH